MNSEKIYDNSTILIVLHDGVKKESAKNEIKNVSGFMDFLYDYKYTNTLLCQVDRNQYDDFIKKVENTIKDVQCCNPNFIAHPASFEDHVDPNFAPNYCYADTIRKLHNLSQGNKEGLGTLISIIDSGISPHPYLPALTFFELINRMKFLPYSHYNDYYYDVDIVSHLTNLRNIEESSNFELFSNKVIKSKLSNLSPYLKGMKSSNIPKYLSESDSVLDQIYDAYFKEWANWYDYYYKYYNWTPPIPIEKKTFGNWRKINPYSKNFIDDDINVIDTHGHGTQMAGIISALPIECHDINVDILGVAPFSDLLILKVYDHNKIDESNIDKVIKALEYSIDRNADLIFIGLAFDDIPSSNPKDRNRMFMAIEKTIERCEREGISVICPAGNDGVEGIKYPAACGNALAISSVTFRNKDYQNPKFSKRSNWADNSEKIDFSAFGGDEDCSIITTDLNMCYRLISGTSVAAAIATGIYSIVISEYYSKQIFEQQEDFIDSIVQNNVMASGCTPFNYSLKEYDSKDLHDVMQQSCNVSIKKGLLSYSHDSKFGLGILRKP